MKVTQTLQEKFYRIIFGTDTKAGRLFDIILLWAILISIAVVMIESVPSLGERFGKELHAIEWFFTILFTLEYFSRILCLKKPMKYILSFYGLIDLLSIIPTWLTLITPRAQFLIVIRALRLLRVFRILKLARHLQGMRHIRMALKNSIPKITVFFMFILALVLVLGTIMYLIEGENEGFRSIPHSIYWAIVTLTTVGYGDITPITLLGKVVASVIMILGYSIIAVPTGIVTSEMTSINYQNSDERICGGCGLPDHEPDANYCRRCGKELPLS